MACFKQSFHGIWRTKIERMAATRVNRFLLFHNILVRWELLSVIEPTWQHRCWRRMLEAKCVGDNFEMLVTVLTVLVTNFIYLLTLASANIQKMSSIAKFCHQHLKNCPQHLFSHPKLIKCLDLDILFKF